MNSPLWELDEEIRIINQRLIKESNPPGLWEFDLITPKTVHKNLRPGLPGKHQIDNAALAVALLDMVGEESKESVIQSGLKQINWPCRIETINLSPWVIIDTAHNVASVKALTEALFMTRPLGKTHLVFAASQDKDIQGMLAHLAGLFDKLHLTRYLGGLRSTAPQTLLQWVPDDHKQRATLYENPINCLDGILAEASQLDMICITGSVFLAGELKPWLKRRFSQQ